MYVNASSGDARIGLNAVAGSDTEIKFSNAGTVQYSIGHDDGTDNFVIGTANVDTPKVSITKSGNVGIGTDNPNNKLAVSGDGGGSAISYFNNTNATGYGILINTPDANNARYALRVNTGAGTVFNVGNGGNVGIGTAFPSAKLEIEDTTSRTGTTASLIVEGRQDGAANVLTLRSKDFSAPTVGIGANHGPIMRWQGFDGTDFENMGYIFVGADGQTVADGDAPSYMSFGTSGDGSSSPTERMRIDSSGNVGIKGTGTKLGWERASDNSANIVYLTKNEDLGVNGNAKLHGYDGIIFSTEGSETPKMTINSSGNVGIGKTAASGYKLDIEANNQRLRLLGTTGYAAAEVQNNGGALTIGKETSSGGGFFPTTGAYDSVLASQGAVNMVFGTNSAERMRIDSSGKVSVGAPVAGQLGVRGTTNDSTAYSFEAANSSGNSLFVVRNDGLAYFPSGNVGIGTATPNRKLHVIGQFAIDDSTSPSGGLLVSPDSTSNKVYSRTGNASSTPHPLDFISGASTSMRIASNGNVGIGTTSPGTPLQVNGIITIVTATDTAYYEGDGVRMFGTQWYRFRNSGGNVRALINVTTGNLSLYNSSNILTNFIATAGDSYFNGGNVGIGTTSPATTLEVSTVVTGNGHGQVLAETQAANGNAGYGFRTNGTTRWTIVTIGTDGANDLRFYNVDNSAERMRITSAGGVSFGTSGTNYGTTGQVLTSTGNLSPTWGGVTYAGLGPEFTDTDAGTTSTALNFSTDQIFTRTVGGTYTVSGALPGMVKQLITTGGSTFSITNGKLIAGSYDGTVTNFIQIAVQTSTSFWFSISQ